MDLAVQAELTKLAMALDVPPEEVEPFGVLAAGELAALRRAVADALDARYRPAFQAIDAAARLLPTGIAVRIATRFFSPLLLGNVATELSPERARRMLPMIDVELLADCVPHLDPERSRPLVASLPLDLLLPTTREVIRRRDHVTLGRMLGALPAEHVADVVPLVTDGQDLLLIGFHTEDPRVLTPIVAAMSDDQCRALVTAAEEHDLVAELAHVLGTLADEQRERLRSFGSEQLRARLTEG